MEPAQLILFNLTLLAAMATPGPALLFAMTQAARGGFRAGLATGIGLGLIAAGWTAAALWGLDTLFHLFPPAFVALKVAGAIYLLWLAWRIWRAADSPVADAPQRSGRHAFWSGMLVNLGNPKSVLFAASVLVVIFPSGLEVADKILITINHFFIEVLVYGLVALTLASPPARAAYLRLKSKIDRLAAFVLAGLGLRLLIGRA
ncbi:MAG: LysE family translocator [Pseudomonadota bacterium]